MPPNSSSLYEQSSSALKSQNKEPTNLTKILNSLEDDPHSNEGFNLQIGDKNIKKQMPKGKNLHTQSQSLRYTYGQIEKEKVQQEKNKNLTFSGVISMATKGDVRTRPMIEVAFKDLTPTFKGKARGCTMTGSILINGKPESIHCYKKIIGYVPQDDIVHGNLIVEENLHFSWSVLLLVVMTLIANQKRDIVFMKVLIKLSYPDWAFEAFIIANVERYYLRAGQSNDLTKQDCKETNC
ncbi:ABC transporter G family member 28 [Glycine soja]|uniref:ABC transporter G family member 28 n=1 Tax=Glycine soja TaxID=3848 RepID=A0A445L874_GLYSO|nr:ABC transporter G family member 28 [Glycine soja]